MGRKKHTRVDKINKLGKQNHFMPVDLSQLTKAEVRKQFKNHPLEQYEQIMTDLFLKGLASDKFLQRAARNYISQTHTICSNCTAPSYDSVAALGGKTVFKIVDLSFCMKKIHHNSFCRVFQFRNRWNSFFVTIRLLQQDKDKTRICIKKKTLKRYKNNRWNWKKKAIACEEGVIEKNDVHPIPQDQTS